MQKDKDCKVSECCRTHRCEILGVIFLVIATILTLLTSSGFGILGMFIAGAVLCCHKHMGSKACKCGCGCCSVDSTVCMTTTPAPKKTVVVDKKPTSKK